MNNDFIGSMTCTGVVKEPWHRIVLCKLHSFNVTVRFMFREKNHTGQLYSVYLNYLVMSCRLKWSNGHP